METIVQFLNRGDVFMARGQEHVIRHVMRKGVKDGVLVTGERADGRYFEAVFGWGETVDIVSRIAIL